jgi:DNA-binding transcriptional regulator LsrR (DeoR family)
VGEIKSTLDLVMEKTRHLTLSDEEKAVQKQKDAQARLKGFIQKYIDHSVSIDQFKKELDDWRTAFQLSDAVIVQEAVRQIDLDGDEQPVLTLLQTVLKIDISELKNVIQTYQMAIQKAFKEKSIQLEAQLADRYGISGTAVVALVDDDEDWLAMRQWLQADCRKQLDDRVSRLV